MTNNFRKFLIGMSDAGAFLGVIFTIAGLLGKYHHFLEIFTQIKLPLAICFSGYVVLKLFLRCRKTALFAVIPLLVNAVPPMMLLLPQHRQPPLKRPVAVKILQANVLSSNRDATKILKLIEKIKPDIIVLQEINRRWLVDLKVLRTGYPVYAEHPREDNFGAAIYCRHTNAVATIEFLSDPDMLPLSKVVIPHGKKSLTVFGVHPLAPIGPDLWKRRNEYTIEFAEKLSKTEGPLIVTGDLNNTPWAHYYKQFVKISGLLDASQGRGPLPTWPVWAAIKLPLDHCFHSADVIIKQRKRGPDIGSDHYPLIIEAVY